MKLKGTAVIIPHAARTFVSSIMPKKDINQQFVNKEEVNEMIESALRRHNRRSTIISSVLGWILIGGYSFGLFQAVQNV